MTPSLSLKRFGLTAFVMLLIVAPLIIQGVGAAPQVVTWGNTQIRSTTDSLDDNYSAIDTDSNGKLHMAWIEYGLIDGSASKIFYTNNVGGAWLTPFQITAEAARGSEPLLDMKVRNNQVHFLYVRYPASIIAHQYVTLNGATPTLAGAGVSLTGGQKGANPELVVDSANQLHAFYISRTSDSAPYQVYHTIWNGSNWGWKLPIAADGVAQKFPTVAATADGKVHLAFMHGGNTFRYYIYNGGAWQRSTDIFTGKVKQLHMSTDGSTIFMLYTAEPGAAGIHALYLRQGNGLSWTTPQELSAAGSYNTNPHGYYNAPRKTLFIFWAGGAVGSPERLLVREYVPGGAISPQVDLGGMEVQYPRAAGSAESVSVIWQDKTSGDYDIRMRTSGGTDPTPVPPTTVPPTQVPTVDFTLNRTSPSPTKDANVALAIANPMGSPNQMRYSLTPFAAGDATLAWQTLQSAFTVNTAAAAAKCRVDIFVQVRNSSSGQVSPVRSTGVAVDTAVQAVGTLASMENAPAVAQRPADVTADQPFAPNGGDPNYTRSTSFFYSFLQEEVPCAGIKDYQVETYAMSPATMPSIVSGFAPFNPFNAATDPSGIGWNEQTLVANLVMTDTLGNKIEVTKNLSYDDDPPVLSAGGSITFPGGVTTMLSIVPIQFTATVTDDGYINSAPADKKYWGVWVVATKSETLPDPQVFAQYGKVHQLDAGSGSLAGVNLTNDYNQESPTPEMRKSGARYIHMRFLDGAGNYSTTGLTSPAITLADPFIDGANVYMPAIAK